MGNTLNKFEQDPNEVRGPSSHLTWNDPNITLRGSLMVSTTACHAGGRKFAPQTGNMTLLGVKNWLSTLETKFLCLSEETLKAVGPFYLVSMPGEVKDPTQGVNVSPVVDATL